MSRARIEIPVCLRGAGFTIGQGAQAGLGAERMRGNDLIAPTSGVRTTQPPQDVVDQAKNVALVLPEPWAFSHLTAARLHDMPLRTAWTTSEPLHVLRGTSDAGVRRAGTVFHRGLESRLITARHEVTVVGAADTWCDIAAKLPLDERVILADAVVNAWSGIGLQELIDTVTRRAGHRGARALREALPLVRSRSRSRMETVARLAFRRGGLPEPELNADVCDAAGEWLSCSDFVWRVQRVIAEYDGDHHRTDLRQWRSDHARRRSLVEEGWRLHVLIGDDFAGPLRIQRRIEAVARDLATPPPCLGRGDQRPRSA